MATAQQDPEVTEELNEAPLEDPLTRLLRHYAWGVQDMDTRRVRKNGWNDIVNAYMSKLPASWPYNSIVTVPLIRTTILEKTSRLLNSKLQGRLIPRDEDADTVKARINNALLDFQWDFANDGGSMVEKIALGDQYARIFGGAWALVYWDTVKNSNEIKIIDPRDIFFDGAANNVRNCRWVMIREFTTLDKLEQRGYDVSDLIEEAEEGNIPPQLKSTSYESIVKSNRDLVDRTGMIDDLQNPVIEVCTEYGFDRDQNPYMEIFLPRYTRIVDTKKGKDYPYKHGKLPISMLRYYPLLDDIYGESEVEGVLPLQRAANAMIDGFLDEANIKLRPPLKVSSQGVRIETIEYGPGARWIMDDPNMVQEHQGGDGFIGAFNSAYPLILQAFGAAMGDQSLGVSMNASGNAAPQFADKTATEVRDTAAQQNNRDQYNQLYLGEFLKDIMMMWLMNNKQFLFDDPTKKTHILKIVGKDNIQQLQQMGLSGTDIPPYAMDTIASTIMAHPEAISDDQLKGIVSDVSAPTNPVVLNPNDEPENYQIKKKLEVSDNGEEGELYITPEDFSGEYDYIPDVKSMAAGAGQMMMQARQKALDLTLNPQVVAMLQTQGDSINIKELLMGAFEDAGYKDAESLFEPINNATQGIPGQPPTPGQSPLGAGPVAPGAPAAPSMGPVPQAVPSQAVGGGLPQPQGIPQQV